MSHLNRRNLIAGLAVLAGSSTLAGTALRRGPLTTAEQFRLSAKKNDWTLGWTNPVALELDTPQLRLIFGKMPMGLQGRFYRNGPAIHERAGFRMEHWFDGDGMVQSFDLSENGVSHKGRMVHTEKFLRDEKAGRILSGSFATYVEDGVSLTGPDSVNAANTSILRSGDELLALWEGGSAYRMNPDTLETHGKKSWGKGLEGMPFSAHPRIEKDGTVWNFGQNVFGQSLIIYKISNTGTLLQTELVKDVPGGMIHDFCMTDRHLIFVAPSFRVNQGGTSYLDRFAWLPDEGQRVVVLDKDDLTIRRDFELPPGVQFHFGNAYEDKAGDIHFAICACNPDFIVNGAKDLMRGKVPHSGEGRLMHAVLRRNGSAAITRRVDKMAIHEFPQFNPDYAGKQARFLYTVGNTRPGRPGESAILRHDITSGDIQAFDYGETALAEEHLFIPRASRRDEADGWLIGTVLDYKAGTTRLNILDAKHISDGPIAVYELPYALPLGFHGHWVGG